MKFTQTLAACFTSVCIGLVALPFSHNGAIAQAPPATNPTAIDSELLQQVYACLTTSLTNPQAATLEDLQAASIQCVYKIVLLAPDGSVRPDASDRMTTLVKLLGVRLPQPQAQGQAVVQLQPLGESTVFTVPVKVGDTQQTFLLDTGASNSIINSQIVQDLGLTSTPLPSELLAYGVVGDNCNDIKATVQNLPRLAIASAQVEGLVSMGMPKTAIPGELPGVVGLDFLSGYDVILNPQTRQLQLLPPSEPPTDAIPLKGKLGVMTTEVLINGQGPFTFLLDTGAEYMVVSEQTAQRLSLNPTNAPEIEVRGFCGTEKAKLATLSQVKLQNYQVENLNAAILQSQVLKLLGVDGIVGQNFLNRYQQHWRFGARNDLGFADSGSLLLTSVITE